MARYTVLVSHEIYTYKLVEADSEEAIYVGDYNVIDEWDSNAGECDQVIEIERNAT